MAGIAGYIGKREAAPILRGILGKMEYSGLDTAGFLVQGKDGITGRVFGGPPARREEEISGALGTGVLGGTLGVGQAYWAARREPYGEVPGGTAEELSPTGVSGRIGVVQSGVIENQTKLRNWLKTRGVAFRGRTSGELCACLIDLFYAGNLLRAVREAVRRLEGAYALGVLSARNPEEIVALRKGSPLVIGAGKGEAFFASETPALLEWTRRIYTLGDGEMALLRREIIEFYDGEGMDIEKKASFIPGDVPQEGPGGSSMLRDIQEEPGVVRKILEAYLKKEPEEPFPKPAEIERSVELQGLSPDPRWAQAKRVVIIGSGSSAHAAFAGGYVFEDFTRMDLKTEWASEYRSRNPVVNTGDLLITLSPSGDHPDILEAVRLARERFARIITIDPGPDSPLSQGADLAISALEPPGSSLRGFCPQFLCLALLALRLGYLRGFVAGEQTALLLDALEDLPDQMEAILSFPENIQRFASRQFHKSTVFFLGSLFDYGVCLEGAFSLQETAGIPGEAVILGELSPGPLALADTSTLVMAVCTQGALFDRMEAGIRDLKARGAAIGVVTFEEITQFDAIADEVFRIPRTPEGLSPLLSVLPLHLFAGYCAVFRGIKPRIHA